MTKEEVAQTWERYWAKTQDVAGWDHFSQHLYEVVVRELGDSPGRRLLEAGAGTCRVSIRLANKRTQAVALDISPAALRAGQRLSSEAGKKLSFICSSIFAMPFKDGAFDLVWNAGVLEHFSKTEQVQILKEMARTCTPGGKVLVLVPFAGAIFYRLGKLARRLGGRWEFGYEKPLSSLNSLPTGLWLQLEREYTSGVADNIRQVPKIGDLMVRVLSRFTDVESSFIKRLIGAMHLVGVFSRTE